MAGYSAYGRAEPALRERMNSAAEPQEAAMARTPGPEPELCERVNSGSASYTSRKKGNSFVTDGYEQRQVRSILATLHNHIEQLEEHVLDTLAFGCLARQHFDMGRET